jgi:hypothetical protein
MSSVAPRVAAATLLLALSCAAQQVDYGTKMQQTIGSAKIVRADSQPACAPRRLHAHAGALAGAPEQGL